MLKTSSFQSSQSQIVFQELRDLFPLIVVAVSFFIFALMTAINEGPKSKPIVRNETLLWKISNP